MAWPKGKPRPKTTAVRAPVQSANLDPVSEPLREGAVQVVGRNNELLTRKRTQSSDIFDIPKEIVPDGWSLDRALCAMEGQGVAAGDGAPGLVNVPARSRFARAVSILGLAFVAAGKALLGDLGLRRFR